MASVERRASCGHRGFARYERTDDIAKCTIKRVLANPIDLFGLFNQDRPTSCHLTALYGHRIHSAFVLHRANKVIISHRHKFIFIKTRKTAGTSVEMALARLCGPDDVITDQLEYHKGDFGVSAQNEKFPYSQWSLAAKLKKRLGLRVSGRGTQFFQHMTAKRIRAQVSPEIWNGYFKFTLERNPWDRQVSQYYWKYKNVEDPPSFRTFILSRKHRKITPNWRMYTDRNKLIVDRVVLHHELPWDLESVLKEIGINEPVSLPSEKSGLRKNKDYRDFYDEDTKRMVGKWYAREIAQFGFEF